MPIITTNRPPRKGPRPTLINSDWHNCSINPTRRPFSQNVPNSWQTNGYTKWIQTKMMQNVDQLLELFWFKHGKPFKHKMCVAAMETVVKFAPSKEASEVDGMLGKLQSGVITVVADMKCPA